MQILAHRGHWKSKADQNSLEAILRAFDSGYGVEIDIRDHGGEIVIAHDPPVSSEPSLESLLKTASHDDKTIAFNIKSDGLAKKLKALVLKYHVKCYFTFDMSIPQHIQYASEDLNVFVPLSELSPHSIKIDNVRGLWLDSFNSQWYDATAIRRLILEYHRIAIVSSELHGRPYQHQWQILKSLSKKERDSLMLCTDAPDEANIYFNDTQKEIS